MHAGFEIYCNTKTPQQGKLKNNSLGLELSACLTKQDFVPHIFVPALLFW